MEEGLNQPTKVRYVEEVGKSLGEMIVSNDPWANEGCKREECLPCETEKGKCMRQGALYTLECKECKLESKSTLYLGETARTPWDRGQNHSDQIRRGDKNHPIVEHYEMDHPAKKPECNMKIIKFDPYLSTMS